MIKQDILENQAKSIYLSIGTNLGDKKLNINKAKILFRKIGLKILSSSSIYETESWPNPKFPNFFNIVIKSKHLFQTTKVIKKLKN